MMTVREPLPILPPREYFRPCIPTDLSGLVYDELGLYLKLCDEDKRRLRQWRESVMKEHPGNTEGGHVFD